MAAGGPTTTVTTQSVADFLNALTGGRRDEAIAIDALHRRVTGMEPAMWGPSIIGYGSYLYRYDSGREGVMCRAGFSPRKTALTFYLATDFGDSQSDMDALFARLGKHSTGKACLYVKKLGDVDMAVLERLVAISWEIMNRRYPV